MNYFKIKYSLDNNEIGAYPQVEDARYSCDIWEDPLFINKFTFKDAPSEVKVANAIISEKADLTDLISANIVGFSSGLLISSKLKKIFEETNISEVQFINAPVFYRNIKIEDYFIMHPNKVDLEYIDFKNSEIFLMKYVFTKLERLNFNSHNAFNDYVLNLDKGSNLSVYIEKYHLDTQNISKDVFVLKHVEGGVQYIVSKNIRDIMIDNSITGVDFNQI